MLKAWEAMRLGKDAQIASLMERCKRHEEEAAEKARSVDSLRRKLALAGNPPPKGLRGETMEFFLGLVTGLHAGGTTLNRYTLLLAC